MAPGVVRVVAAALTLDAILAVVALPGEEERVVRPPSAVIQADLDGWAAPEMHRSVAGWTRDAPGATQTQVAR